LILYPATLLYLFLVSKILDSIFWVYKVQDHIICK
jgi:hypothetical protein